MSKIKDRIASIKDAIVGRIKTYAEKKIRETIPRVRAEVEKKITEDLPQVRAEVEQKVRDSLPQIRAQVEEKVKENIPRIRAQVEEKVNDNIPRIRAQAEEKVRGQIAQVGALARAQAETQIKGQLVGVLPRVETFTGGVIAGDGLVTGPFAVGFVAGGGVGGTLGMPFKLVRVAVRRLILRSRMEAPRMKIDKSNKELGNALAAIASADGQIRRRRGRLIRLFFPSFRKVLVLGSAGAAYLALNNENGDILATIGPPLEKVKETVASSELYEMVAPDIEKAIAQVAERIDAIR
jgi:hypothetical protein